MGSKKCSLPGKGENVAAPKIRDLWFLALSEVQLQLLQAQVQGAEQPWSDEVWWEGGSQ